MWSPEKTKEYSAAYYRKHQKKYRQYNLVKKYGCSADQFDSMVADQTNKCASCRRAETVLIKGKPRKLAVDHDHETGKIRGLLCSACNMALGQLKDDPLRISALLNYIERVS